jgi:hypothetical protein
VPEQSSVKGLHRPDGVVVVWFSKPSQKIAALGHEPVGGEALALADGDADAEADADADADVEADADADGGPALGEADAEDPPLHETPLRAKFAGAPFAPEKVPWKPKFAVPPDGMLPL